MSSSSTTTSSTTTIITSTTTTTFQTGVQYGFFYDASRCNGCHACAVACKSWLEIPAGPQKPARLQEWETGSFPNVQLHFVFTTCFHCANPICVPAANGAMMKEPKYGVVLMDPSLATTQSMRDAAAACPYGAITFDSDADGATAVKCNMCVDRLEQGLKPVCVMTCPMRALDFDTMANLEAKYGTLQTIEGLPDPSETNPSVVFKPTDTPKQFVPYNPSEALPLLANRGNLPPLFDPSTVTTLSTDIVGRNHLVLKPAGVSDPTDTSIHDEG